MIKVKLGTKGITWYIPGHKPISFTPEEWREAVAAITKPA